LLDERGHFGGELLHRKWLGEKVNPRPAHAQCPWIREVQEQLIHLRWVCGDRGDRRAEIHPEVDVFRQDPAEHAGELLQLRVQSTG
jgi:hypothetical protein